MKHRIKHMSDRKHGFTLIELLLVVGIIAVLAGVVFVALDPAKRFRDSRDARRLTDIENILSAVHQYVVDNQGAFPAGIDTSKRQIGTASGGCQISGACEGSVDECVDLSQSLAKYLKTIPVDPAGGGTQERTHYAIQIDSNNLITVTACEAEALSDPSVSR